MLLMPENSAQRYLDWIRGSSYAMAGLLVGLLLFRQFYPYVEGFARHILLG
jgi:hypothetical protein